MSDKSKHIRKHKNFRSIGRDYFYKVYKSLKIKYDSITLRNYRDQKTNRRQELPKQLYFKIINTYLDIYFFKFYFTEKPRYFFLGGKLAKYLDSYILKMSRTTKKAFNPIILKWLHRPSYSHALNIMLYKASNGFPLKKMHIAKLDKIFKEEGDIDSLPVKKEFNEDVFKYKKYFING